MEDVLLLSLGVEIYVIPLHNFRTKTVVNGSQMEVLEIVDQELFSVTLLVERRLNLEIILT